MSISDPIALSLSQPSFSGHSNESELAASSHESQSTTSLPATTNTSNVSASRITFAPLPLIEPRKRRSTSQIKLGVAGRGSMMRHRRLNNGKQGEPQRDPEEGRGGALKRSLPSSEMWEDYEMECPRSNSRSERLDDPLLAVGRMVKSAWRRVSQVQTQTPPSTSSNRSARGDDNGLEPAPDVSDKLSEEERKVTSERERRRRCSHEECAKARHMPSVKEGCVLDVLGSAPIRNSSFKIKKPVLVRSATEPWGKTTTVASTFKGR